VTCRRAMWLGAPARAACLANYSGGTLVNLKLSVVALAIPVVAFPVVFGIAPMQAGAAEPQSATPSSNADVNADVPVSRADAALMKAAYTEPTTMPKRRALNPALAARASQPAEPNAEILIEGILRDSDGTPSRNARIRFDLEPTGAAAMAASGDEGLDLVELAQEKTDGQGRFKVKAKNLGDLTGYVDETGASSILVTSFGDSASFFYHLRVLPSVDGKRWKWETYDAKVAAGPNARALSAATSEQDAGGAAAPDASDRRTMREKQQAEPLMVDFTSQSPGDSGSGGEIGTMGVNGRDYCASGYTWRRDDQNGDIITYDRMQRAYTKSRVTSWTYKWATTNRTQRAVSANVGTDGKQIDAGFVSVQENTQGVDFNAGANTQMDARAHLANRPWRLYCHMTSYPYEYSANIHEWRPVRWTGFSSFGTLNTTIFSCQAPYTGPMGKGTTWFASNSTLQFSAGANLAGVSLRTSTSTTDYRTNTSHRLELYTGTSATICGNGNYPANSPQVREQ
jgi:hypothetical protein